MGFRGGLKDIHNGCIEYCLRLYVDIHLYYILLIFNGTYPVDNDKYYKRDTYSKLFYCHYIVVKEYYYLIQSL